MHILLVTHFFPPMNEVASIRAFCFAKFWDKAGVKVTVLTSNKLKNRGSKNLIKELPGSVNVIEVDYKALLPYTESSAPKAGNMAVGVRETTGRKIKKVLKDKVWKALAYTGFHQHELFFWTKNAIRVAGEIIEKEEVTHVFSTYSPIQSHLIGSELKRKYPAMKWIADYRDLWAENHIGRPHGIFNKINIWLEKRTVHRKADLITVVSPPLRSKLESFFPGNTVKVIYNGFDPDDYKHQSANVPEQSIFQKGAITIAYLGTIYEGFRDPTPLFMALNELQAEEKIKEGDFCIYFYGARLGNLDQIINRCNAGRWTKVVGNVDFETSKRVQKDADLLLFLESSDITAQGVLPGKLFEYIMSGTPIVGIGIDESTSSGEVIMKSNSGVVLGKDVIAIKEFLVRYVNNRLTDQFLIDYEYFNSFSREYQALLLLEEINKL